MTKIHTNKAYESELRLLRDRILVIAGRIEKMIDCASKALSENDVVLARKTIDYDKSIDRDEMIIDRQCIELLATRQPLGQDLRFVVSVIKMVTYFERLGDLAVKICHRVIKLKDVDTPHDIDGILKMSQGVQSMLKETLEAFLFRDHKKAMAVIRADDAIDEIYHTITRRYIKDMAAANHDVESYYHLLSIAKWLERMGDHCTNLAELIIFMVKGEDIRHQQMEKPAGHNAVSDG
jgi:phosphate transport system protein